MKLPEFFCWTKFGAEAGQAAAQILRRKDDERRLNSGVFLWGVGNSVGPGIKELLRFSEFPEVLFSPIKSPPKTLDSSPSHVAAWISGQTCDGLEFPMPARVLVTSRFDVTAPKKTHYALVCYSASPLVPLDPAPLVDFSSLRNIQTGNPLGSSQVTAIVKREKSAHHEPSSLYRVYLRAYLIPPYFIRLHDPVTTKCGASFEHDWPAAIEDARNRLARTTTQGALTLEYP